MNRKNTPGHSCSGVFVWDVINGCKAVNGVYERMRVLFELFRYSFKFGGVRNLTRNKTVFLGNENVAIRMGFWTRRSSIEERKR